MVPLIYRVVAAAGVPPDVAIRTAFGTSLMVVLATAISATFSHNRNKTIRWKAALVLGPCGLAGALVGAKLATYILGETLQIACGGLILAAALWMGLGQLPKHSPTNPSQQKDQPRSTRDNPRVLAACGFPIGIIGGLSGIGGGVLIVPALVLALNFPIHLAVGTSIASVMFISLGGATAYIVNGIGVSGLLPHSIGYVNLPAWVCLAATSIPMSQLGARAAHALPARQLTYAFIGVMLYMGLKMAGLFAWLGLPI